MFTWLPWVAAITEFVTISGSLDDGVPARRPMEWDPRADFGRRRESYGRTSQRTTARRSRIGTQRNRPVTRRGRESCHRAPRKRGGLVRRQPLTR